MPTLNLSTEAKTALRDRGWTILDDFVSAPELKRMARIATSFISHGPDGFYNTHFWPDRAMRLAGGRAIQSALSAGVKQLTDDGRTLLGAFCIKPPGAEGAMFGHQDWNIVDESVQRSYNLWVPLRDVACNSGALQAVPMSHRDYPKPRGPNIPPAFSSDIVESDFDAIPLRAGSAVLMDHAVIHRSGIHDDPSPRIAVMAALLRQDTPIAHYFGDVIGSDNRVIKTTIPDRVCDTCPPNEWAAQGQRRDGEPL
jgi:hypothetical protein